MTSVRFVLSLAAACAVGGGLTYAATVATRVELTCPPPVASSPLADEVPPSRDWLAPVPPPVRGGARY